MIDRHSTSDWAALESLLESPPAPRMVASTSYGSDAPVSYSGPTPGMIGAPKPKAPLRAQQAGSLWAGKPKDAKAIWTEAEVGEEAGDAHDLDDGRPQPEYEIVFKQRVSPEDLFLGIDPLRHGGVACSDELLLRVRLPGCRAADLDLDVRSTCVRLQAPRYKLRAHLPERVDEARGRAQWDADKETLQVTLPVISAMESTPASAAYELD